MSITRKQLGAIAAVALALPTARASNYDDTTAQGLAYLAAAAYCDPGPVQGWSCLACTKSPITVSNAIFLQDSTLTNFAYCGTDESDGSVVLSYRGSDDIQQWINNLKVDKIPFAGCSGCNVHEVSRPAGLHHKGLVISCCAFSSLTRRLLFFFLSSPLLSCLVCSLQGFYEDYSSLSAQLASALSSLGARNASAMKLTGHSLGAAEANLAAFELSLAGYPIAMIYNYGQPRVGDPTYAAGFDSLVVSGSDGLAVTAGDKAGASTTGSTFSASEGVRSRSRSLRAGKKGKTKKAAKKQAAAAKKQAAAPAVPSSSSHSKLVTVHSVAPAEVASLNPAFLSSTDASKAPLSFIMVQAIERALNHPVNHDLLSTAVAADKAGEAEEDKASFVTSIMAIVREHALKSADAIELKKTALKAAASRTTSKATTATKRESDSVLERFPHSIDLATRHVRPAFSPKQMEVLTALRFPVAELQLPEDRVEAHAHASKLASISSAAGGAHYTMPLQHASALLSELSASTPGVKASGFTGAEVYRVTHNADIVPHVPPTLMGFQHGVSETWYDEAFDSYTECSTTNGEDPSCSDSVLLPVSVSDHLSYFNFPISNSC